jgi:hypothetical protein
VGQALACGIRLLRISPYARISVCMVSGWVTLLCYVDVAAIKPSMSNSFEYVRKRTKVDDKFMSH